MKTMSRDPGLDKPLPENLDAERFVLGAIMTDSEALSQVSDLLRAEDFVLTKHRTIFRAALAIQERGDLVNYVSVGNELMKLHQLESCEGVSYLVSLSDGMPRLVNLASFCEPIRSTAVRRRAIESMWDLMQRCYDLGEESADLLVSAERISEVLNATAARKLQTRTLDDYIAEDGGINPFLTPDRKPGIQIPFADIHATLSGLRKSKLILVGARPAVGKTAFATQIAEHASNSGSRVLFITLEMGGRDLFHRAIAGRAQVSAYRFREGKLSARERQDLVAETSKLRELGDKLLLVDKSDTTVQGIFNLIRSSAARGLPIDLCIIDYLQLLNSVGSFENRVQEVSKISRELKKITLAFQIPVIALCQLKRIEDHRKNAMPELDWLKESGQLEQDADQVFFLWIKKEPEEGEMTREVHWRVAKNRDGMLNHGVLTFQTKYCRFDEGSEEDRAA